MNFLTPDAHEAIYCQAVDQFGEILWHLLKSAQMMKARLSPRVEGGRSFQSEFAKEVGRDEIHWWIFNREENLDQLNIRSGDALEAAESLKRAASEIRRIRLTSYQSLLTTLRGFAEAHQDSTRKLLDYLIWLRERDPLAPSMLFTYRVWGSTRRSRRWLELSGGSLHEESQEVRRQLTELALGLQQPASLNVFDYELMEAMSGDDESAPVVSETEIVARTSWQVLGELLCFLEQLRDSLKNVLLDIEGCLSQRSMMYSDDFWRRFIAAAAMSPKFETHHWDFKETLDIWQVAGREGVRAIKKKFAEYVAAFANADGGVLIVGVSDDRRIVGIDSVRDLESALEAARKALTDRIDYPRELVLFHQASVQDAAGVTRLCLVIIVASAMEAVGVNDEGNFTYPARRETGLVRLKRNDISIAKIHRKNDNFDFFDILKRFVRDSQT